MVATGGSTVSSSLYWEQQQASQNFKKKIVEMKNYYIVMHAFRPASLFSKSSMYPTPFGLLAH